MNAPLCLPLDPFTPRGMEVADFAISDPDTCTARRATALVIVLNTAEEVAAIVRWMDALKQPATARPS